MPRLTAPNGFHRYFESGHFWYKSVQQIQGLRWKVRTALDRRSISYIVIIAPIESTSSEALYLKQLAFKRLNIGRADLGNVRKVQKLSRHRQLDTLMIYDDNRGKDQAEVTGLLDDLV